MSAPAQAIQEAPSLDLAGLRQMNFKQLEELNEVREVAPGLYLGPAALVVKGKPHPILFFAVSFQ